MSIVDQLLSFTTYGSTLGKRKRISGSGIILLETYNGDLCVTLFNDKHRNHYEDGGGSLDASESEAEGALRELKEESCNLFRLNKTSLSMYYDHQDIYRAYIVHIKGPNNQIFSKRYYDNLNILKQNSAPRDWLDTNGLGRFKVSTLISDKLLTKQGDLMTSLADGTQAKIFGRTKACIRELYNLTNKFGNVPIVQLNSNENFQSPSNQTFLSGTKCYWKD